MRSKVWFAAKLEWLLGFYRLSEGNSIERSIIKIVVTKKIAAQYKYVVNFYIVSYFLETMIGFMAWLLNFTNFNTYSRISSCFYALKKWRCFVTREYNMT